MEPELMLGSKPRDLGGTPFTWVDPNNGRKYVASTACYTRDDKWKGWQVLFTAEPNDALGDLPHLLFQMSKNFKKGKHCKGRKSPIPMDEGHKALTYNDQKILGKILGIEVLPESKEGAIVTYDEKGQEVVGTRLAKGGGYLLGLVCYAEDELENIKKGVYGDKYSVAFGYEKPIEAMFGGDPGEAILYNVAFCQVPAKDGVPEMFLSGINLESRSGQKAIDLQIRTCKLPFNCNGTNIKRGEISNMEPTKKRVDDQAMSTQLHDLLVSAGASEEDASSAALGFADESAKNLIPILQKGLGQEETDESEPSNGDNGSGNGNDGSQGQGQGDNSGQKGKKMENKEMKEMQTTINKLSKDVETLSKVVKTLDPKLDDGFKGAMKAFMDAKDKEGKPCYNMARSEEEAKRYCGLGLSEEQGFNMAKRTIEANDMPTFGSEATKADVKTNAIPNQDIGQDIMKKAEAEVDEAYKGKALSQEKRSELVGRTFEKLLKEGAQS